MLRELGRKPLVQALAGGAFAGYLGLVRRTNRFLREPIDVDAHIAGQTPLIMAAWHGQHLMSTFAWPKSIGRMAAMISRHADGGINAAALAKLGVVGVRGSGSRGDPGKRKGGAPALLGLMRMLEDGASVAMTADVPKRARVAGMGIITLARLSGRPIAPAAVVASRRIEFKNWDRACLGLPFGRCAVVVGDLIHVAVDADEAAMEAARRRLEAALDAIYARAYAMIGASDPGAELRRA